MRITSGGGSVFPHDAALPGLPSATDAASMRAVLEEHLLLPGDSHAHVEDCRISRVRYRPATRCFVQYLVTVRDRVHSRRTRCIVTGAMYAEAGRAARHARKAASGAYVPDLQMVLSMFPEDRKLPQASRLVHGRERCLEQAVLAAFGGAAWTVDTWQADPVRYREQLCLVMRYRVRAHHRRTGTAAERVFYLKTYPELALAIEMHGYLARLANHTRTVDTGVRIDPPLACLPSLNAVLFEHSEGQSLLETLTRGTDGEIAAAAAEAGRAVAGFNQSHVPTRRRFTAADYLASLQRPIGLLSIVCPDLRPLLDRVLRQTATTVSDDVIGPTHRDMKPDHVLLGARSAALIDLDSCAAADPVLDAALMLARFSSLATSAEAWRAHTAAAAFEDAYLRTCPRTWRARLPAYYAASLVEVAAGLFHRQDQQWRERIHELVHRASAVWPR